MKRSRPLILRIITRLAGGGPPVHVTTLNRRICDHGFDSVLVFGNCASDEKNMEYLLGEGDQVERIPELGAAPSPLHDLKALYSLWRVIRKYRPDIVHTHTAKAGFLGRIAAWLAGCPRVVHTYHGHVLEGYFSPSVNRAIQVAERSLGALSSALLTVSNQQAEELSGRFSVAASDKFHVVPLGLDLNPYVSLAPPNFESARLRLAWLGRFVPIKNLELLLSIAELAQTRGIAIDFTIAGDGPLRENFEKEAARRKLRNVDIMPWQDDVLKVLDKSHLLIMTSHREGTPLSLIQGLAAGRPFISTPAGGTVDLGTGIPRLDKNSWWYDNAVLVSANPEAFVEVLSSLCLQRQQLKLMSQAARRSAVAQYSDDRLTADIARLYHTLLPDTNSSQAKRGAKA